MLSILVTGSDTAVGKTHSVGLLALYFSLQHKQVQIVKPVETGVTPDTLKDAEKAKLSAISLGAPAEFITSYTLTTFELPLAAFSAAKKENRVLEFETLVSECIKLPLCDVRLYEGAGGIASPLTHTNHDWTDFAEALGVDLVILVVADQLGAINQARLCYTAISKQGIKAGIWLNQLKAVNSDIVLSNHEGLNLSHIPLWVETAFGKKEPHYTSLFKDVVLSVNPLSINNKAFIPRLEADLSKREQKKHRRFLNVFSPHASILNLIDNDYLNLCRDPEVSQAGIDALKGYGNSASASALISGWTLAHQTLLNKLCQWHQCTTGLIWSSGYAANTAILSTLPKEGDLIFADKLIHNSMISGLRKSGATFKRYPHLDLVSLERMLAEASHKQDGANSKTCFVVTESVFSMDGDYPNLVQFSLLKKKYPFIWILDEAHALGWYGEKGSGLASYYKVTQDVDILIGTLGKTLASGGAYSLFHTAIIRDYLINYAGEFIYSTALPPVNAALATAAIGRVLQLCSEQHIWHALSRDFREQIMSLGFKTLLGESPIIPVFMDSEDSALSIALYLKNEGILVSAIRPPTVATGTSRIRISLKRGVTKADLDKLIELMKQWRLCR